MGRRLLRLCWWLEELARVDSGSGWAITLEAGGFVAGVRWRSTASGFRRAEASSSGCRALCKGEVGKLVFAFGLTEPGAVAPDRAGANPAHHRVAVSRRRQSGG